MIRLVEFSIDDKRLAVPLEIVDSVIRMCALTPMSGTPEVISGIVNVRGKIIAAADLRVRLGIPSRPIRHTDKLLVVKTSIRPLALIVDDVSSVLELNDSHVSSSNSILPNGGFVQGVAVRPDGMLFIYDVDLFLSLDDEQKLTSALQRMEGQQ